MADGSEPDCNLTSAVGPGAANERSDVLLAQYLLRAIYAHPGQRDRKPPGVICVDGHFGPITASWIDQYQQDLVDRGEPVFPDGRLGPIDSQVASENQTLWHLLRDFRTYYSASHDNLQSAGAVPAELAQALRPT